MNLTKLITARVTTEMGNRIKAEVRRRRIVGQRVNEADIVREALIEHFKKQPREQSPA